MTLKCIRKIRVHRESLVRRYPKPVHKSSNRKSSKSSNRQPARRVIPQRQLAANVGQTVSVCSRRAPTELVILAMTIGLLAALLSASFLAKENESELAKAALQIGHLLALAMTKQSSSAK